MNSRQGVYPQNYNLFPDKLLQNWRINLYIGRYIKNIDPKTKKVPFQPLYIANLEFLKAIAYIHLKSKNNGNVRIIITTSKENKGDKLNFSFSF